MLVHPWWHKQPQKTQVHNPEHEDKFVERMFVCSQITIIRCTFCIMHFILFNHFSPCISDLLFHINYITSHYYIPLRWLPSWRWQKMVGTCSRNANCLYIIVSNYSAFVGVYVGLLWNKPLSYSKCTCVCFCWLVASAERTAIVNLTCCPDVASATVRVRYSTLLVSQLAGMVSVIHTTSFLILRTHSLKLSHFVPTFIINVKVWRRKCKSQQLLRSRKEDVFENSDEDRRLLSDKFELVVEHHGLEVYDCWM